MGLTGALPLNSGSALIIVHSFSPLSQWPPTGVGMLRALCALFSLSIQVQCGKPLSNFKETKIRAVAVCLCVYVYVYERGVRDKYKREWKTNGILSPSYEHVTFAL